MWNTKFIRADTYIYMFFPCDLSTTSVGNACWLFQDKSIAFQSEVLYYWQHGWVGKKNHSLEKINCFLIQCYFSAVEWSKDFAFKMDCPEEVKKNILVVEKVFLQITFMWKLVVQLLKAIKPSNNMRTLIDHLFWEWCKPMNQRELCNILHIVLLKGEAMLLLLAEM